jgi:hypothetical protein
VASASLRVWTTLAPPLESATHETMSSEPPLESPSTSLVGPELLLSVWRSLIFRFPSRSPQERHHDPPVSALRVSNHTRCSTDSLLPCSERDTTLQVIGKIDEVVKLVADLCSGLEWCEGSKRLPAYTGEQEI